MEKYLLAAPLLINKLGQDEGFRSFFSRRLKTLAASISGNEGRGWLGNQEAD